MRRGVKMALGAAVAVPVAMAIYGQRRASQAALDIPDPYRTPRDVVDAATGLVGEVSRRLLGARGGDAAQRPIDAPTTAQVDLHGGAVPSHEGPEPVEPATHLPPSPPSIVGLAKQRPQDVAHIRRHAEDLLGSSPLPPRFTDAELMRHAVHQGFLRTHDDASRARALSHAATSVAHTVEWLRRHEFASEDELQQYAHLLWWSDAAGNPSPGNDPVIPGQPLKLHVAIGRAVQECRGPAAVHFANAVITQVERAVTHRLRDEDGADRVDVVVYAAGTSALSASRAGWVLKAVVSTLSHHYPGRLNELVLLDLPKVLTLMVLGAKKLVHAETSRKVRSTTSQEWVEVLKRRATEASTGVRMER